MTQAKLIAMPQDVKMFHCDDFLEAIKHDFATKSASSTWIVWYEIDKYDMYLKIKKTDEKITIYDESAAFDDDESKFVYKTIEHHQKNSFHKLRDMGWCSEYHPRGSFGYFEFLWCSPCDFSENKYCNCRSCLLRF